MQTDLNWWIQPRREPNVWDCFTHWITIDNLDRSWANIIGCDWTYREPCWYYPDLMNQWTYHIGPNWMGDHEKRPQYTWQPGYPENNSWKHLTDPYGQGGWWSL